MQVTDKELYHLITAGAPLSPSGSGHASFLADRAEIALRTGAKMGCSTRVEALMHLGKHFRVALPNTIDSDTDIEVRLDTADSLRSASEMFCASCTG